VASRNERKENIITIWGFGTLLGKRGVNNEKYSERKNWRSIVPAGNLYNKRSVVGGGGVVYGEGLMPLMRGGGE